MENDKEENDEEEKEDFEQGKPEEELGESLEGDQISNPPIEEEINNETDTELSNDMLDEGEITIEIEPQQFNKNLIEASLFVAGTSLTIEEVSNKLNLSKKEVENLMKELAFEYLDRNSALIISQLGEDTYQLQIKPEYMDRISKFAKGGAIAERYLRTLTIIALKQPILKSTLIKIRGSGAYEHVSYLLENGYISAKKKGRTQELTTTDKYAEMYGMPKNVEEMKRMMIAQLGIEEKKEKLGEN